MKWSALTVVVVAFGLAVTTSGVVAQDKAPDRGTFSLERTQVDSRHIVGLRVDTPDGKRAGEIDYLIVDMKNGNVSHLIVGLGGLAGVGERHVVVPWSQVKIRHDGADRKDMVAVIDGATLNAAPRYSRADRDRVPAASPSAAPATDDRPRPPASSDRVPTIPDRR